MANPRIVGGKLKATGAGAVGIYCAGLTDIAHIHSIDATAPLEIAIGATANVIGVQFDPTTSVVNGTLNYLSGDRAAWNTSTYFARHASDIEDSSFTYHNDPAHPPISNALTNTHIFVGNASNIATDVAMSNDATMANTGALTIANQAVTYAKIQNISATQRVLGRNTAGAGSTEEVTASQELDWIGVTRGSILVRGASGWIILAPGDSGNVLTSNGAGADPSYQAIVGGVSSAYNETQTGDGSTTIYYLANYALPGTVRVYINGILQPVTDDTVPSDTVTFTTPPAAGAVITVNYDLEIV